MLSTEIETHFKSVIYHFSKTKIFSIFFFFWFSFLVWKPGWSGRKSAQNQHLRSHTWGESKHYAKQKTAEEKKLEQVKQSTPARATQTKHCFAAKRSQGEKYSKKP